MRVVALVGDLMDRSRLEAAVPGVTFGAGPEAVEAADVVVVDLARHGGLVAEVRLHAPAARVVCYGPHVDSAAASTARSEGADVVLPRSRFFRDPAAALER